MTYFRRTKRSPPVHKIASTTRGAFQEPLDQQQPTSIIQPSASVQSIPYGTITIDAECRTSTRERPIPYDAIDSEHDVWEQHITA